LSKFIDLKQDLVPLLVGFGLFLPIFFTLSDGLYRSSAVITDSGGRIMSLPLPISLLTCGFVILFNLSRLRDARVAKLTIIGMVSVLVMSHVFGGEQVISPSRKIIASLQVMLPFMGLLVGNLLCDRSNAVAKSFLMVLTFVVPFQIFGSLTNSGWAERDAFLSDQVGFFTIYSHIQYVSLIFVCAFAYTVGHLFDQFRWWLLGLIALMLLYVLKSWSYLTMGAYACIVLALLFSCSNLTIKSVRYYLAAPVVIVAMWFVMVNSFGREEENTGLLWRFTGATYSKVQPLLEGRVPDNVQERIGDWKRFGGGILEEPKTILVGHAEPMPREVRSSAHNWYIDTAYTFGVVGVLPVLGLLFYSGLLCWSYRRSLPPQTWWLVSIVFYLVVIDSNFKVTLRQPYPGIFAFFMWGLLLARLDEIRRSSSTH
jgi:hypothetical protein